MHQGDVSNIDEMKSVVRDVRPHHVIHLAAISNVASSDIEQMYRVNVLGTRQLLEALTALGDRPQSVVVASSANVYGNSREGELGEKLPLMPVNDYGVSKVAAESVAAIYSSRLPMIVVRPFNYTGVGQSPDFVIPKIVANARERATEIELGNIDVARDFSDVRTVVEAYVRLIVEPKAIGGTFNICSGEATSLREILQLVSRLTGHQFNVSRNEKLVRTNEVQRLCGSAERLMSVVGPLDRIPIEQTLRWMLDA